MTSDNHGIPLAKRSDEGVEYYRADVSLPDAARPAGAINLDAAMQAAPEPAWTAAARALAPPGSWRAEVRG